MSRRDGEGDGVDDVMEQVTPAATELTPEAPVTDLVAEKAKLAAEVGKLREVLTKMRRSVNSLEPLAERADQKKLEVAALERRVAQLQGFVAKEKAVLEYVRGKRVADVIKRRKKVR